MKMRDRTKLITAMFIVLALEHFHECLNNNNHFTEELEIFPGPVMVPYISSMESIDLK